MNFVHNLFLNNFRRQYLFLLFFCTFKSNAQTKIIYDTAIINTESVVLYADPRLSAITAYHESLKSDNNPGKSKGISGSIHSGKGFRVLIYSGIDRAKANNVKSDFMRRHPGIRVYMSYALPQYRVKVGDYTTRKEANDFYRQLNSFYSPCMVVPDIIEVNTFKKNDQ